MPATDIYLAQTGAGAGDGSSCSNPRAATYFNSSANWGLGATQIGSGTTIHLCGSISTVLTTPTSQGTGLITVKWETGAKMSAPANQNFFVINNTNAWKFNGGFPCGPQVGGSVTCNGVIENTANGTNLANQKSPVRGFDTSGATGAIEITGIEIRNLYVHTPPVNLTSVVTNGTTTATLTCSGTCGFVAGEVGLTIQGSSITAQNAKVNVVSTSGSTMTVTYPAPVAAGTGSSANIVDAIVANTSINCLHVNPLNANLTIHDGVCHDVTWAFDATVSTGVAGNVYEIYNMDIFNHDHTATLGSTVTNGNFVAKFHDNHIHSWANWDSGAINSYHHDGFHFFNSQTQVSAVYIYNNLIDHWDGINNTSPIFNQVALNNSNIFNNVFKCDVTQSCHNAPPLHEYGGGPNQLLANNTYIGSGQTRINNGPQNNACILMTHPAGLATGNNSFLNNLMTSCNTLFNSGSGITYAATTATSGIDFNLYANYITDGNRAFSFNGTSTNSLATWQSLLPTGGDAHSSLVASAGIDSNGVLQTTSPAKGAGTNLTSLCVGNLAPLCFDTSAGNSRTPVQRSASAAWDIGAYAFGASTPAVPIVSLSPISVNFGSQIVNTTSSAQVVTLSNIGTASLTLSATSITGTNASEFSQSATTCGGSLAASASCTYSFTFTPALSGVRTATFQITDNASGSPHSVSLTGTGGTASPIVSLPGTPVVFPNTLIGQAAGIIVVPLINSGTANLIVSNTSLGGLNASEFFTTNTCTSPLAPGAACFLVFNFVPAALGPRFASLAIVDNAADSPQTVTLFGNGTQPVVPPGGGQNPGSNSISGVVLGSKL